MLAFTGAARGGLLRLELADRELHLLLRAVAPQFEARLAAWLEVRDARRQFARALDRLAVHCKDHVARLHAGLRRGPALVNRAHESTGRALETERFCERLRELLDADADAAALHRAMLYELRLDLLCHVDRNCER